MPLANDLMYGRPRGNQITKALTLQPYTVATLPPAAGNTGRLISVSNGAAGQPCLAFSNGTAWVRVLLGAAVATS
jgi:hypothetical protein